MIVGKYVYMHISHKYYRKLLSLKEPVRLQFPGKRLPCFWSSQLWPKKKKKFCTIAHSQTVESQDELKLWGSLRFPLWSQFPQCLLWDLDKCFLMYFNQQPMTNAFVDICQETIKCCAFKEIYGQLWLAGFCFSFPVTSGQRVILNFQITYYPSKCDIFYRFFMNQW